MKFLIIIILGILQITHSQHSDRTTGIDDETNYNPCYEIDTVLNYYKIGSMLTELKIARKHSDHEYATELSRLVHNWWKTNNQTSIHPATCGGNSNPVYDIYTEYHSPPNTDPSRWGVFVRIDPNDDVYNVKIASLSNGELYAISTWDSSGNDHILVHRSTNDGWDWNVYWNLDLDTDYEVFYPGIRIINDTIVMWYILHQNADNTWKTWLRTCLPGISDSCIYYGSPTGGFNSVTYSHLYLTDDSPIYDTDEYVYATWVETYGTEPDSTYVMFARSDEIDISSWELGPTRLYSTSGANTYFRGTKIAYGSSSDVMWLTAWLHPSGYPSLYDRSIWGWYSSDYGTTWSIEQYLTPMDNGRDEFDHSLAGSHSNNNWVLLFTQVDTSFSSDRDIFYCYSTDDTTWIMNGWLQQHDEYLPDVWVDHSNTGFFGAARQDGSTFENILYRKGNINDPTSWTQSAAILNTPYINFSGIYGASLKYNSHTGDAIMGWTMCDQSIYSIWFSAESWFGINDGTAVPDVMSEHIIITPNISIISNVTIYYTLYSSGPVHITLYNAAGRLIKQLVNGVKTAGRHSATWNCSDETGCAVPAGIYFVQYTDSHIIQTKKLLLIK